MAAPPPQRSPTMRSDESNHIDASDTDRPNHKSSERILGYTGSQIDEWSINRQKVFSIVTHAYMDMAVSAVILFNICVMIYETDLRSAELDPPTWVGVTGVLFLSFYCCELSLRFYVFRLHFFKSTFNILDFAIVGTDLIFEMVSVMVGGNMPNVTMLRILRVLRALRFVRAIRSLPFFRELYMIMNGFFSAMKAIVWATVLLFTVLMLWSVVAVELIHPLVSKMDAAGKFDDMSERCGRSYSSTMHAMLTFTQQVVALDAWGEPSIPIIETHPWTAGFFAAVLVTVNLGLMNLILSVIVGKAQQARQEDLSFKAQEKTEDFKKLKKELLRICTALDTDNSQCLTLDELLVGFDTNKEFHSELTSMDVGRDEIASLFYVLDDDDSGEVAYTEFVDQLHKTKQSAHVVVVFLRGAIQEITKTIYAAQTRISDVVERSMLQEERSADVLRLVNELSESHHHSVPLSNRPSVFTVEQSVGGGCCGSPTVPQEKFQDSRFSSPVSPADNGNLDAEIKALRERVAQMQALVNRIPGAQLG